VEKSERNEKRKLRAVYWNNIGVGLMLAGSFIPVLSIFYSEWMLSDALWPDWRKVFVGVVAILVSMALSFFIHVFAIHQLDGLED
jgi:hypothetical protein